jgi:ribosomal protein S13
MSYQTNEGDGVKKMKAICFQALRNCEDITVRKQQTRKKARGYYGHFVG